MSFFPFHFGKSGSSVLANCSLCGTEATLSFSAGSVCSVFPLQPARLRKLFADLGSSNKFATFLLFSSYLTVVLSSSTCPLLRLSCNLNFSGSSGRNCLLSPPILSGYNGSPDTRFSQETTQLMS